LITPSMATFDVANRASGLEPTAVMVTPTGILKVVKLKPMASVSVAPPQVPHAAK